MKLYYVPGTCAIACWIALEWAGAEYEAVKVDYNSAEFKKINPLGMVPAIDIGGPRAMTQGDAILTYIAERYSDKNLGANAGLEARFEFHETMSFLTGDFHPAFWPYFSPSRFTTKDDAASLAAVREATNARVERVLSHLNNLISDDGFVYGNKRSIADAYAFVMTRWSEHFPKSWKGYDKLAMFMQKMSKDPAVIRVMERSVL